MRRRAKAIDSHGVDTHGGNIYAAARERATVRSKLLDFSASINPLGPSRRALAAIDRAMGDLCHYPDPGCVELRQRLAAHFGIGADRFLVGNGSSELIRLLPAALSIGHAVIVGPTFSEYERGVRIAGGRITPVMAQRSEGYAPPLNECMALIQGRRARQRPDTVFLCNPNSPTGQAMPRGDFCQIVEAAGRRRIRVVADETFVEYCEHRSLVSLVEDYPHLLILRSFTKFYALPGLRVGYVVGSRDHIRRLAEHQPPWSVNTLGHEAACAALADHRHAQASRSFMQGERAALAERLGAIPGFTVYPSEANFLMADLPPRADASAVTAELRRKGVLIRDLSAVPGLTKRTIRVAVQTRTENERLLFELSRCLMAAAV